MESEYGQFFLSNYRPALLEFAARDDDAGDGSQDTALASGPGGSGPSRLAAVGEAEAPPTVVAAPDAAAGADVADGADGAARAVSSAAAAASPALPGGGASQAAPHGKKQQPRPAEPGGQEAPKPPAVASGSAASGDGRLAEPAFQPSPAAAPEPQKRLAPPRREAPDEVPGAPGGSGGDASADNGKDHAGEAELKESPSTAPEPSKKAGIRMPHLQLPQQQLYGRTALGPRVASSPVMATDKSPTSSGGVSSSPKVRSKVSAEDEAQMAARLDGFFEDPKHWAAIFDEVNCADVTRRRLKSLNHSSGRFVVRVPKPYPGLQYRKSKNLLDKVARYAEDGSIVTGQVVDDGEWLQVNAESFLPTMVGAIQILEPLDLEQSPAQGCSSCWAPILQT